ncbi:nitrite reductase [Frankia sp. B2]|uniref:nitrite reductase n=1 Tax=Frankia sp. B2 TaxID=2541730 RepID=UPI00106DBF5D|nr:nitrite reductase [Frankia sp. B2]TFE34924.1 nitrite reductase [Frankia sp. B2]
MPTSPRERVRDACPGVLTTHPAADGALARLRLPGGRLTAAAAKTLAGCAREFADGHLELTSRANVQLRGLADGTAEELAARVSAVGLLPSTTHERVRNIVGSPLSGRGEAGCRDIAPVVAELDRRLCADPALAALPGRLLFAVDDGSGDLAGLPADLALRALPSGEMLLAVAGATRALRLPVHVAVPALLAAARAFIEARAAAGTAATAWRIAELPGGPGGQDGLLAAAATEAGVVGIVQAAGIAQAAGSATVRAGAWPGPHPQRDGRRALTVLVPLGRLSADQLDLLTAAAAAGGGDGAGGAGDAEDGVLVVTPWRSVVLRDLDPAEATRWSGAAADAGLVVDPASSWVGVTSCAGRPGCARALADVRRDAAVSVRIRADDPSAPTHPAGRPRALPPVPVGPALAPVHWSGCERRCGQPGGRVVEVVATGSGYRIRRTGLGAAAVASVGADGGEATVVSSSPVDGHRDLAAAVRSARRLA